jgi:hypothetical protein
MLDGLRDIVENDRIDIVVCIFWEKVEVYLFEIKCKKDWK